MDLNHNRVDLDRNRYPEVKRASDRRNAEIKDTVQRVQQSVAEHSARAARLAESTDSIELSRAAREATGGDATLREERVEKLRTAAEDGSLFDRDRLARAAERLLVGE